MYDARTQSDSASLAQKIALGAIAGSLVIGMLAATFLWPTENQRKQAQIDNYQLNLALTDNDIIPMAMPGLNLTDFESSILELDKSAHADLEEKLKQSANQADAIGITFAEIETLLQTLAPMLAQADIHYADAVLARTRDGLRSAAANSNPYCQGTNYSAFRQGPDPMRNALIFARELTSQIPEIGQYSADIATLMLQAATNARHSPASYGPLTSVDKAAIEGVVSSLLDDPDIKKIALTLKTKQAVAPVLETMDVCIVSIAAITAISTLPQDTKARLWADIVSDGTGLKAFMPN